jgi:cytochrome b
MSGKTMQMKEIEVWDPLVRTGHWLLATAVIVAWFVDEPLWLHSWLGYIAIALVLLRIVWGFIGPDYARFASFVRGPRVAFGYFIDLIRFSSKRHLGHSPAGAVMIIALLVMVAVTAVTGMASLAATRGEGPFSRVITKVERPNFPIQRKDVEEDQELFIEEVHETAASITMVLSHFAYRWCCPCELRTSRKSGRGHDNWAQEVGIRVGHDLKLPFGA